MTCALLVDAEGVDCAWSVFVCAEGCLDYVTIIAAPVTATSGMRFLVRSDDCIDEGM
jgi:hypothetical protein